MLYLHRILGERNEEEEEEEEEELKFYDLSALYRLFKSLYSHIYHAYRGKKGETEFGYRETWHTAYRYTYMFLVCEVEVKVNLCFLRHFQPYLVI